ncbi:hypothetical protein HYFRA_00003230 [Hymenoscyphus fraxineus]|uniref:Uncharacterized protein n=1 Tax=Hymenoscyphus fraxineus TaxID=746836 RepID=A0A9N9KX05_9HELO|nr:hypothetical protein HYFRA_00003230 [Hymenoscyphus fraxineus]
MEHLSSDLGGLEVQNLHKKARESLPNHADVEFPQFPKLPLELQLSGKWPVWSQGYILLKMVDRAIFGASHGTATDQESTHYLIPAKKPEKWYVLYNWTTFDALGRVMTLEWIATATIDAIQVRCSQREITS